MRTAPRHLLIALAVLLLFVLGMTWFVRWITPARPELDDEILIPRQANPSCSCRPPCRCVERARPAPGQRCHCCGALAGLPSKE